LGQLKFDRQPSATPNYGNASIKKKIEHFKALNFLPKDTVFNLFMLVKNVSGNVEYFKEGNIVET
jgi:hypothetical protein